MLLLAVKQPWFHMCCAVLACPVVCACTVTVTVTVTGHVLQYCPNAHLKSSGAGSYDDQNYSYSSGGNAGVGSGSGTTFPAEDTLAPGRKKKKISICFNCGSTEHALSACPTPRRLNGFIMCRQ